MVALATRGLPPFLDITWWQAPYLFLSDRTTTASLCNGRPSEEVCPGARGNSQVRLAYQRVDLPRHQDVGTAGELPRGAARAQGTNQPCRDVQLVSFRGVKRGRGLIIPSLDGHQLPEARVSENSPDARAVAVLHERTKNDRVWGHVTILAEFP